MALQMRIIVDIAIKMANLPKKKEAIASLFYCILFS
tara:strand:- start:188 stop:295 length:108 start_codon:yes stop_codon:yes gene_type:complete